MRRLSIHSVYSTAYWLVDRHRDEEVSGKKKRKKKHISKNSYGQRGSEVEWVKQSLPKIIAWNEIKLCYIS